MRRMLSVISVSFLVNLFLFFMMTQMLTGKKFSPKKQVDFQGIEFIHFKAQDLTQKKMKGAKAERPVLPEPPSPLKITLPLHIARPNPAEPKLKPAKPKIEKIKPVIHSEPPLEKFKPDLPLPAPIPIPDPISIEERPDPVPLPEKVVIPDWPPLKNLKAAVIDPEPSHEKNRLAAPIANSPPTIENLQTAVVDMQSSQPEALKIVSPEVTPHPPEGEQTPVIEQKLSSSVHVQADVLEADMIEVDVLPLLRTRPRYPRRAIRAKLEGMVTIEFTIQTDGSVSDPIVVASAPPKVFDRAALRAIRKWKFRPKQVKGTAVIRRAIQNIQFSLKSGKK